MADRARWWNRLAAWAYERLGVPLMTWLCELSVPVWSEQAEADLLDDAPYWDLDDHG